MFWNSVEYVNTLWEIHNRNVNMERLTMLIMHNMTVWKETVQTNTALGGILAHTVTV